MPVHSLCSVSARLATGEKESKFMPAPQDPDLSIISPRPNLTETVKKGSLLHRGLLHVPQEWIYYSKFFSTKNLYTPKSILCSDSSFDSIKCFSISIYHTEEKWSIFLQNKRRNFSERKSEGEGNKPFLTLLVPRHGPRYFIILILTPIPVLTLTNTNTDTDNVDTNTRANTNTNTIYWYQY